MEKLFEIASKVSTPLALAGTKFQLVFQPELGQRANRTANEKEFLKHDREDVQ